jgi:hypothetical protein
LEEHQLVASAATRVNGVFNVLLHDDAVLLGERNNPLMLILHPQMEHCLLRRDPIRVKIRLVPTLGQ